MNKNISCLAWILCAAVTLINPLASGQVPDPVGLWEFDNSGNLGAATIGSDLTPNGSGFTAGSGVSGGDGAVTVALGDDYTMTHGIAPVGGELGVNRYTLLFDFRVPATGIWHSFFQVGGALTDAEYFINPSGAVGVGDLTYSPNGTVVPNTWYRLVFSMDIDQSGNAGSYTSYFNGTEINSDSGAFSTYGRFSLASTLLLFNDNDSEDNPIDVSNVAIWNQALSASQAAELGAAGDPIVIPATPTTPTITTTSLFEEGDRLELDVPSPVNGASPIQWSKNNVPLANGGTISGATSTTLVIDPLVTGDTGNYSVTYDDGSKVATMAGPVAITVVPMGALPAVGIIGLLAAALTVLAVGSAMVMARRGKISR